MKRYYLIFFLILNLQLCYSQNVDSIINILEGKWDWYKTYGGYAGQTITPADSGFTITVEFTALQNDSVNFCLFKNDTLVRDTVATIFHIFGNYVWAINKSGLKILSRYFPNYPGQEYLGLRFTDSMDLIIFDIQVSDGYAIYFKKSINSLIQPINQEYTINIYPNPFRDKITIRFNSIQNEKCKISIYDCSLKNIYEELINLPSGNYIHKIENLDSFPPGIYFLKIAMGENVYVEKIIGL